jgi:uncharacterized protein (DUF2384 family)
VVTDQDAVELALRAAAIKARLNELYAPQEAHDWIHNPQRLLDGQRPIDMLGDILGYLEVDNIVDHMLECTFI